MPDIAPLHMDEHTRKPIYSQWRLVYDQWSEQKFGMLLLSLLRHHVATGLGNIRIICYYINLSFIICWIISFKSSPIIFSHIFLAVQLLTKEKAKELWETVTKQSVFWLYITLRFMILSSAIRTRKCFENGEEFRLAVLLDRVLSLKSLPRDCCLRNNLQKLVLHCICCWYPTAFLIPKILNRNRISF